MPKKPKKITKKKKQKNAAHRRQQELAASLLSREWKRHGPAGPLNEAISLITSEKMSAVIIDFAQPYIEEYGDDDFNAIHNILSMAIIAWNASFMPEEDRQNAIEKVTKIFGEDDPEASRAGRLMFQSLLARKQLLFADNQRLIVSYEVTLKDGSPYLTVTSSL